MRTLFSFEVPIKHLRDFEDLQDFHFTLSMLFSEEGYASFIEEERKKGLKTIWLDNSYNEKMQADQAERIVDIFYQAKAHKLISPDDPSWSTERILENYQEVCTQVPMESVICVVNSPEMQETMLEYGVQHFALSYWVRPNLSMGQLWQMRGCHYLGLLSPDEIVRYRPPSCDTSMPIKLAMKEITIGEWVAAGCPHVNTKDLGIHGSDFFSATLDDTTIDLARENIKVLKEMCND